MCEFTQCLIIFAPFVYYRSLKHILTLLGRLQFFILGFHYVTIKGQRATFSEAPILCFAPHTSFFDAIIAVILGLPSTVSREENRHVPIVGSEYVLH